MYMCILCIHARPTPVRSFPKQNKTRQIGKLWTFYRLSYIRKRKKRKKKYFFYSLLRSWDLLLSKPKWIPGLTRTILDDSSEHLFSLREEECDWAGPQGSRRQDRHTRSLPFAKPAARLPAQGFPPASFAQRGSWWCGSLPWRLMFTLLFPCKQRVEVTRPFQEGSQEDVSVFFLAGHKSNGNDDDDFCISAIFPWTFIS